MNNITARGIGRRMAMQIVLVSSIITFIITSAQLIEEYHQRIYDIGRELDDIEFLVPSLTSSVWTFDSRQIRLGLGAISNMPNMESASITETAGGTWTEGRKNSVKVVSRDYALIHEARDGPRRIGTLKVTASLDDVYRDLLSRAIVILVSNGIKTFFVAGFMLFLFSRLVTSRVARLELKMGALADKLALDDVRPPGTSDNAPPAADEIDALESHFNKMASQLEHAITELETKVQVRTADLESKNKDLSEANIRVEISSEAEHRARLEQRNFVAMVSHELRVPLSVIGASSELLGIYAESSQEAQEEIAKIGRALSRMTSLIDIYLADERLDSSELVPAFSQVDINAIAVELCQEQPAKVAGRLVLVLDLPSAVTEGDAILLRVALSNLIDNALKYSPAEMPVDVLVSEYEEGLTIEVADRGPGIAPVDLPRLFEKFFRSNKENRVAGAGLGLYIVHRIIELHGGDIAVDGRVGGGTIFIVHLPRRHHRHP